MTRTDATVNFEWTNASPFASPAGAQSGRAAVISIDLLPGTYQAEWVNTLTGRIDRKETIRHKGGGAVLASPSFKEDIALKLIKK